VAASRIESKGERQGGRVERGGKRGRGVESERMQNDGRWKWRERERERGKKGREAL